MFHHHHRHEGRRFGHGFGREGGHGPHHHRRGGFGGRMFGQGDLRLVILALIAEKPRHGYEIIKAIEDRLAGTYSPSPGVIYPTLTLMEEIGQVTAAMEGSRKLYTLTPEGEQALAENRAVVDSILARMTQAGGEEGVAATLQIRRAMENLKLALRMRMGQGPIDAAHRQRIADAIDAAARVVEQG
ncbi:PadR family transcriptional regulator [Roseomonas stagni]|uniref:PadR family transcriptional regulator n=1 Tax=Falsiroseomonas algicola TaxID=2716930 RepID=A0A6M1LIZ8_9PROT|nr:PadR family transcriptional regulator [Falsiroseomonas algicola]NGM20122.1 PadR family transcriptional regulator [Falsiroseomonas algicola]